MQTLPDNTITLDENGFFRLQLTPAADGRISGHLYSRYSDQSSLVDNLLPLMSLGSGRDVATPQSATFSIVAPRAGKPLVLKINGEVFARYSVKEGKIECIAAPRKLSVFETRTMGRAPQKETPVPQPGIETLKTPLTDLHTHLSAQVSGRDLIALGRKHNILYPVAALQSLGIDYPSEGLADIPRRVFLPLAHLHTAKAKTEKAIPLTALSDQALTTLEHALSMSPEKQNTYEEMEKCYYLREPFTKNITLLPEMLRKVAENYRAEGITYAELSSNAVVEPDWLETIHRVLPQIEEDTGVALRFLAGLPRNLDEDTLGRKIDQIKHVARSPYVVGVDVLGYEINKTSRLQSHLEELAEWMRDTHPDMILRIHAGENSKNPNNVKEALQLAQRYGIRMRIGHALFGIDDETLTLARELAQNHKLMVEFNPDSNLALNNIDFSHEITANQFIHHGIASVFASDGSGLYLTSAKQIARAAALCGITPHGFDFIHKAEASHIAAQEKIFTDKQRALPDDFFKQLRAPMASRASHGQPIAPHRSAETLASWAAQNPKHPILIAGTAGKRWKIMRRDHQREIITGITLLLEQTDPDKAYFVTGRTKDSGVGIELGKAIAQYNATHPKKFECLLLEAESQGGEHPLPEGINHKIDLPVPLVFLANEVLEFIKQQDGAAYFFGGRLFTRNFILKAHEHGIAYGLMDNIPGASFEKARIYPGHAFIGAKGMLEYGQKIHPETFTQHLEPSDIARLYKNQISRVRG